MNNKIFLIIFVLIGVFADASAQRRTRTSPPAAQPPTANPTAVKPQTARLMVQGTYEETFQGTTSDGNADGHLVIKFEAARWLRMETNEAGNAEFSDLEDAPVPDVSGSVSYQGSVKGGSGGESYNADSSFSAQLGEDDIVLTIPEYADTGDGLTMSVLIQPTLKGKCSTIAVRNGKTTTSNACDNGTFFITATSTLEIEDNDDPAKSADTANLASFEIELVVEPDVKATSDTTADPGVHAWRGAVTSGTKEAGFKITLTKTKELPRDDKRGKITRKLTFTATIVPGAPK